MWFLFWGSKNHKVPKFLHLLLQFIFFFKVFTGEAYLWSVSVSCQLDIWRDFCYLRDFVSSVFKLDFCLSPLRRGVSGSPIGLPYPRSCFCFFSSSLSVPCPNRDELKRATEDPSYNRVPVLSNPRSKISPLCPPARHPAFLFSAVCFHWRLKHLRLN